MKAIYVVLTVAAIFAVVMCCLRASDESLSRRRDEYASDVQRVDKIADDYRTMHDKKAFDAEVPKNAPDDLFHPAPVISGRVQSTQSEHLDAEAPVIDIDYKPVNNWPLTKATLLTPASFKEAVNTQIVFVREMIGQQIKQVTHGHGIKAEYMAIFAAACERADRVMNNWPTGNEDGLSVDKYQAKLSDQLYASVKDLLHSNGIEMYAADSSGGVQVSTRQLTPVSRVSNQASASLFAEKPRYRLDNHRLVETPLKRAHPIASFGTSKLLALAQKHVRATYASLMDKYQYLIQEMPQSTFQSSSDNIISVGNEMVVDFIKSQKPSLKQLDQFERDVREAMREALFEILIDGQVDVEQFEGVTHPRTHDLNSKFFS